VRTLSHTHSVSVNFVHLGWGVILRECLESALAITPLQFVSIFSNFRLRLDRILIDLA